MSTITVADRAGLLNAFETANGGDTIVLKDGHYGAIKVTADFASTVTVRAEGAHDATISGLVVSGGTNIRFDGIEFDSGSNGGPGGRIVSIQDGSRNVAVVNSEVTGKVDGTYSGHFGIYSTNSSGVTIANNDVRHVDSGIVMFGTSDSQVSGNAIDYLARDAMKFAGLNNVTIADNVTYGHYYSQPANVHNDFIQFQGASSNVLIDGNMLLVNTNPIVQGIFLDDGAYKNITVQNNIIYNGISHGVTVTNGSGITVRNNTLLNTPGEGHNGSFIMVPGGSVVENNISTSYPKASGVSGSNLVVQNKSPGEDHYVDDYFVNGSAGRGVTLQDLVPVKGSLGESKGAVARLYELLGGKQPAVPSVPEAPAPDSGGDSGGSSGGSSGGGAGGELAINAGGRAAHGFAADAYFSGGDTYATSAAIGGTGEDAVYQSERYGDFKYSAAVANGTYEVTLKFAEIYLNGAGQRLFDVRAENQLLLDNFDVFAAAGGKNAAVDRTFQVKVSDGRLDLDFSSVRDNAKVSGIEIVPAGGAAAAPKPTPSPNPSPNPAPEGTELAINAGGKAAAGFAADAFYFGGRAYATKAAIGGTSDDAIYQSERYGDFKYAAAVENGTYEVTLKFAEIYLDKAGQRLFDVEAENRRVLDNYDVFREAGGKNVAHDESFEVRVTDGRLDLEFISVKDNAKVSGIEIDYLA
jgi:parallel beta-helix repeat protein